jgi:hypothetical protein
MNWKRPVPFWLVLIVIVTTASATAGVELLPSLLSPKPDFAVSLSLHPMYVQGSGSNQTLIMIQPVRNFTGAVTVTTYSPSGLTTQTQDPQTGGKKNEVVLGFGGNLSLVVYDKKVGNFTVTVIASSGTISHSASFPVIVQNLTMTSTPSSLTIMKGSSGTTEIDISSVNGFSDNITLGTVVQDAYTTGAVNPYIDHYSNASLTPTSIVVSPRGMGKIALRINIGKADIFCVLFVIVGARAVMKQWTFQLYIQVIIC